MHIKSSLIEFLPGKLIPSPISMHIILYTIQDTIATWVVLLQTIHDGESGEESVLCEGKCNKWIHRACTGLSEEAFLDIGGEDSKWACNRCSEMTALQSTVASLVEKVRTLESLCTCSFQEPLGSLELKQSQLEARIGVIEAQWSTFNASNFEEELATVQEETSSLREDLRLLKRAGTNAGVESQTLKERPQSPLIEKTCVQDCRHSLGDICLLTPAQEDMASFVSTDNQHSPAAIISPANTATQECHCVSPSKRSKEPEASPKRSYSSELLCIPNVPCENRFKLLELIGDDSGNDATSAVTLVPLSPSLPPAE